MTNNDISRIDGQVQELQAHVRQLEAGLRMAIENLANATRESANVITAEIRTNTEEVVRNTTVSARQEIAKQEASLMAVRPIIWEVVYIPHPSLKPALDRLRCCEDLEGEIAGPDSPIPE